jgi:uncharacterized protein YjbI with pentapeptide repeats
LYHTDLNGAILSGAILNEADLKGADLSGADLRGALLVEANLRNANLDGANLSGAYLGSAEGITNEELEQQAGSLEGATMPNGQKYEAWLKDRGEDGENGSPS